jgi:hypothetical protein
MPHARVTVYMRGLGIDLYRHIHAQKVVEDNLISVYCVVRHK